MESEESADEEILVPRHNPGLRRMSRSLRILTKNFLRLLQEAEHGELDLKYASRILAVAQKRRIYDITNVLEGIGLLVKISKSRVKWLGASHDVTLLKLRSELEDLKCKEFTLDQQRILAEEDIRIQTEEWRNLTYVTNEDICNCFSGHIILTVKAPPGTQLDVPIPKAVPKCPAKYQIYLKSIRGPIHVFLLNKRTVSSAPVVLSVPPPEEILQRAKSSVGVSANKESNDGLWEASALITKSSKSELGAEQDVQPLQKLSSKNANKTDESACQSISKELQSCIDSCKETVTSDLITQFISSKVAQLLTSPSEA